MDMSSSDLQVLTSEQNESTNLVPLGKVISNRQIDLLFEFVYVLPILISFRKNESLKEEFFSCSHCSKTNKYKKEKKNQKICE